MNQIDRLAANYSQYLESGWLPTIAGGQRVLMLVYPKETERSVAARVGDFETRTHQAGKTWRAFDCACLFGMWMGTQEYRSRYFERPDLLAFDGFGAEVACRLRAVLQDADADTVVAVVNTAALYGLLHISELVHAVDADIAGRLAIFFPGHVEGTNYRFLDGRDGWNYLAQAITTDQMGGLR